MEVVTNHCKNKLIIVCTFSKYRTSRSLNLCHFIDDSALLYNIRTTYDISPKMINYLLQLREYKIVIVCDDSGSMKTTVDNTERTRWDELRSIVKIILEISVKFDSTGVDIYFLNRKNFLKVKDPQTVDQAFAKSPSGYTPLIPVLERIFKLPMTHRDADKKLLVFVATDGAPTDEQGEPVVPELERLMVETRQSDTTYVSFLLCTDDPKAVGYLTKWDRTMKNVDVTDDYETQTAKIRECQRNKSYQFSYGDYIVKALVGAIIPIIDRLDEPKVPE